MKNAKRIIEVIYQLEANEIEVTDGAVITQSLFTTGGTLANVQEEVSSVIAKFNQLREEDANLTHEGDLLQDMIEKNYYFGLEDWHKRAEHYSFSTYLSDLADLKENIENAISTAKKTQGKHIEHLIELMNDPREYLCVWGSWEKAPTSYPDNIAVNSINAFTGQIGGYTIEDEAGIKALQVGETFRVSEGNHIVTRLK